MTLFEVMKKAKIGDQLRNTKLGAEIEWDGSIWCIPGKFYNLNYSGWEIIDYILNSGMVMG